MANIGFAIAVDARELRRALQKTPAHMVLRINQSLRRSAVFTQRAFREELPVGATGSLRRSVNYAFANLTEVNISPKAKHAEHIEYGTKPHWTSVKNLERWARMKGINPYAVQRGIAKHGTKPHPFLFRVHARANDFAGSDMTTTINKAIDEVL